jgi:hypothetical protein
MAQNKKQAVLRTLRVRSPDDLDATGLDHPIERSALKQPQNRLFSKAKQREVMNRRVGGF